MNHMEALSFDLLDKLQVLDEMCPKHPQQKMVQLPGQAPFCPICTASAIEQRTQGVITRHMEKRHERTTKDVLRLDSIFDDPDAASCTFANYVIQPNTEAAANRAKARQIAGKYLHNDYQANTILTGNPGTGKTHLAMAMLHAVNDNIKPEAACLFVSINELVRRVKDSFNNRGSWYTEENVTRLISTANLLVLDDLGSEASFKRDNTEASDWVQQLLFGLLNKRRGRTIITTNLTSKQLTKIYNPKLLSRMYWGVAKNDGVIKFTDATPDKREDLF
ncbi:ATP-binding protein [Schleiferilactobacillus harbinensis]|uniref:ATP-binding protein n=1 Tax=Schleiferilactobacillus harbinensis TaxID=304207 RepID=UPI00345EB28D